MDFAHILALIRIILFGSTVLISFVYSIPILFVRRFHNRVNILTLNICLASLICSIYFTVYFIMFDYYIQYLFTEQTCLFILFIQSFVSCGIPWSIVTLSISRFCTVIYHTKAFFKTKIFMALCFACQWTAGCLMSLPFQLYTKPYCDMPRWLTIYTIIILIIIPGLITLVINLCIFKHVHSSSGRVQPKDNLSTVTIIINQKRKLNRRDLSLLRHTIIMFSMFVIGWTPIYVLTAIDYSGTVPPFIYTILQILIDVSLLASLFDLFSYNHELRKYVKDKLFPCF
ncbi:unnamed protein product [Adineta steineri]|uniref:G-protein coupled receptors family 1 profile domain-containing protein n=1 Tax=Adineta steineri TaxID=433720 RepID=A0A819WZF5_9BILA|nr:unnamed protein product [Adineta steineri]